MDEYSNDVTRSLNVVFAFTHSSPGGAQNIWKDLAEGLHSRGWNTSLMALYPSKKTSAIGSDKIQLHHISTKHPSGALDWCKLFLKLVRWLLNEKPEFVLSAHPATNVLLPIAALIASRDTGVILSHHTPITTYSRPLRVLDRWVGGLKTVYAIVCVSDAVKGDLAGWPKRYMLKVTTIKNALPPQIESYLTSISRQASAKSSTSRQLIATGRLSQQKNYHVLIRAMMKLEEFHLKIVGDGEDRQELEQLSIESKVNERVEFVGFLPRLETLTLLQASDAFIQPSLFEGHSLAIIEAAKLGVPMVVSNVPSQVEAVTDEDGTHCAAISDVSDPSDLAMKIRELFQDEASYQRMARLSASLGTRINFSDTLDKYEKLLSNQSRKAE